MKLKETKMLLEVGKGYIDGYGNIVTIVEDNPDTYGYRFTGVRHSGYWNKYTISGKGPGGSGDLVTEYVNMDLWNSINPTTTEEPKKWSALPDTEKGLLLLAELQGETIQVRSRTGEWMLKTSNKKGCWNSWGVYRAKPKPPKPREFWVLPAASFENFSVGRCFTENPHLANVVHVREVI
jgi:hypothetical protein